MAEDNPRTIPLIKRRYRVIRGLVLHFIAHLQLSYLPPLMVYLAAGISGLTSIVGTFFIKDYLDLPAEFLAMLGFWAGLPWALKMPLGHVVDLIWRWKSLLVLLGAALISASLAIMVAVISSPSLLIAFLPLESWFVISVLLAPIGYVIQDVVADAMTVEAVPVHDQEGQPLSESTIKMNHTTMQTLGRAAIVTGGISVSLINILMFKNVATMVESEKIAVYSQIYTLAMIIPLISVSGVILAELLKRQRRRKLSQAGGAGTSISTDRSHGYQHVRPNWWILGASALFVLFTVTMGLFQVPFNQEIVFAGSMTIVLFLMAKLTKELNPSARRTLFGTAMVIFVFRSLPGPGAGASWWQIDELGFDQQFMSTLSLIGSTLALFGMFIFRRFMAEHSIFFVIGFLTIVGFVLSLPIIGMFYGLHEWTAGITAGVIDARFIAVVDTALESPFGQIAMIPMLAWIANSAPAHLKATFFAVMASFTNLALSLSNLLTKYLNQLFTISREVTDPLTGNQLTAADYSELGLMLITVTVIGLVLPVLTIMIVSKRSRR